MIVVVFRATVRALDDEYRRTAARMRTLALGSYGCLGFHAVTEGDEEIAISYWPSEEAVAAWHADPEHREAQRLGRSRWYSAYSVDVATVQRAHAHPDGRR